MDKLRLAVCRTDITPEIGGRLYGYRDDFYSTGINDRLFATAFCFTYNGEKSLLVSTDVCLINTKLAHRMRAEISADCLVAVKNIILTAVHTHTGPNTAGEEGWGAIDTEYCESVFIPEIRRICKEASSQLGTPVKVGFAVGESKVGINRRELFANGDIGLGQNEWGTYDPDMTVISFADYENKPIANIIHYGAHNTAAGLCPLISRDWCGVMCDRLEALSGCPSVYFNGCEGDVGPRLTNGQTVGDINYAMEHGAVAANDAVNTYKMIKEYRTADMKSVQADIDIPLDKRVPLEKAREEYEKYKSAVYNIDRQTAVYYERVIKAWEDGVPEEKIKTLSISILRIANLNFIAFPYEMFSEISLRLKKSCKNSRILCLSNANGNDSYFPSQDQMCRGGYEVNMFKTAGSQPMVNDADNYLVTALAKALEEM